MRRYVYIYTYIQEAYIHLLFRKHNDELPGAGETGVAVMWLVARPGGRGRGDLRVGGGAVRAAADVGRGGLGQSAADGAGHGAGGRAADRVVRPLRRRPHEPCRHCQHATL